MFRSTSSRLIIGVVVAIALLALLRYKPWQRSANQIAGNSDQARPQLNVGFLPVT